MSELKSPTLQKEGGPNITDLSLLRLSRALAVQSQDYELVNDFSCDYENATKYQKTITLMIENITSVLKRYS